MAGQRAKDVEDLFDHTELEDLRHLHMDTNGFGY